MAVIVGNPTSRGEIWNGDLSHLDCRQYPTLISQNAVQVHGIWQDPSRLTIKTDTPPPGLGQYVTLSCQSTDSPGGGPPRCQLQSPFCAHPNNIAQFEGWTRLTYDPAPGINHGGGYFLVMEIFNSPFAYTCCNIATDKFGNWALGGSPLGFANSVYWNTPYTVGTWTKWRIRQMLSTDPTIGWTEFDFANDGTDNVVPQTLSFNGNTGTRVPMQTINYNAQNQVLAPGPTAFYPDIYTNSSDATSSCDHAGYKQTTIS